MQSTILIARQYGPPETSEFITQDMGGLRDGFARVKVKAAGINPIDARRMTGEFRHASLPQAFGSEFAGEIVEVGSNSFGWKVGDEVLGSGSGITHATVIDVALDALVAKPKNMDWSVAGSIAGAAQVAMTIWDQFGDVSSVLVHGASGGVGSIFIQLKPEVTIVGTASEKNQEYLKSLGITPVVYGEGLIDRIRKAHPAPFDASIDMIGNEESTQASLATVKPDGIIAGISGRPVSSPRVQAIWTQRSVKNLKYVVDGIAEGKFNWEVSRTFPFSQAAEAYNSILKSHTRGKSVFLFD
jgi:NADPH:quinone reductase-like Zn-dependent oxidoreductase